MTKFLLSLIGIAVLILIIANDTWLITLSTTNYDISISFVLFITGLCLLWYILSLLVKPFGWWTQFRNWRTKCKQEGKNRFLVRLLTSLLNHNTTERTELLREAKSLYGSSSQEFLLISALLHPQQELFQQLCQNSTTKLAGIYGLVETAQKTGNFEEIALLLEQVPQHQQKTPWVQQTKMQLALNRSDWSEALRILEANKQYLSKQQFTSHKAALLLKLGQVKKAYHLQPNHIAIVLAYAKVTPRKAKRILEKAWKQIQCWPIYVAYKESLLKLPEHKRLKAVLSLTRSTRDERYSLLARADMDIENQNWARAKENLENYLQKYPLTRQVANMMAFVERTGWHHEQRALEWENKAIESENDSLWICEDCSHAVSDWHILCPHCNAFDTLRYK